MKPGQGVFMGEGEIMQRVTDLAHRTGCLIIIIAHGGKRDAADDPMQMIASTNALPASVDDVLVLFRDKDDDDEDGRIRRKLFASGRNIAKPGIYVLEKRETETAFVLKGSEGSMVRGESRQAVLAMLNSTGNAMTPSGLATALGLDRGGRSNVHRALESLVVEKLVVALDGGKYESRTAALVRASKGKKSG
jgi:hypothetical protein